MRIAVFSDIHANRQAWRAVHADMVSEGVDGMVCLGDIVGYGPEPQEVLDAVRAATTDIVLGNHDAVIGGLMDSADFNDHARDIIEWTRSQLNPEAAEFFRTVPEMLEGDGVLFTHAEAAQPQRFSYLDNEAEVRETFNAREEPLIFIGHTHVPCVFALNTQDGVISRRTHRKLHLRGHERHLVNVGSVGEPRDGDPRASYVIYDDEARTVDFRRVEFDVDGYLADLANRGLNIEPAFLAAHRFRLEHPEMDPAALTLGPVKAQPAMRKPATPPPATTAAPRTGTRRVLRVQTQPVSVKAAPAPVRINATAPATGRPAAKPAPKRRTGLWLTLALVLVAAGGAGWWMHSRPPQKAPPPPATPLAAPETPAPAVPAAVTPPAPGAPATGSRLTSHDADPGPVWLVRFGKAGGTMGKTDTVWNHLTETDAPVLKAQWTWKDTRGLLAISATMTSADGALAAARDGVRGRNIKAFGHKFPDSATGGAWSARAKEVSFTLRLAGLNPSSRYVFLPLLAGSSTDKSPVRSWKATGALNADGAYEAAKIDGLDISTPVQPASDGSVRLSFFLPIDGGASGLNTLAIKELRGEP